MPFHIPGLTLNLFSFQSNDNESNSTLLEDNPHCPWKCELINESGYVVYSALGSFYIPMFVMLFFYWRIYLAAIRTTQAINQGFKITGMIFLAEYKCETTWPLYQKSNGSSHDQLSNYIITAVQALF